MGVKESPGGSLVFRCVRESPGRATGVCISRGASRRALDRVYDVGSSVSLVRPRLVTPPGAAVAAAPAVAVFAVMVCGRSIAAAKSVLSLARVWCASLEGVGEASRDGWFNPSNPCELWS